MSNLYLHHMLFGSRIEGGKSILSLISNKMAYKKAILDKFQVESDSSKCRSPRHDGQRWYIPDSSLSEDSKQNKTSGEDPDLSVNPSTSSQGNTNQLNLQDQPITASTMHMQPPKKRHWDPQSSSSG